MDIEREVVVQVVVGTAAVLAFIAMVVAVGLASGSRPLDPGESTLMVGAVVAFIVLSGALGLALSDQLNPD